MSLSEHQLLYGEQRLKEFALSLKIDVDTALHILQNVQKAIDFFEWINADEFLLLKQSNAKSI